MTIALSTARFIFDCFLIFSMGLCMGIAVEGHWPWPTWLIPFVIACWLSLILANQIKSHPRSTP